MTKPRETEPLGMIWVKSWEERAMTPDLCTVAGVELRAGGQRMKQETGR